MYNNNVKVPLVIRTPMGGRRGYGPTHSQSLEKMFLGIPGLKVVAPNTFGDPGNLLEDAISDEHPVLFVEHKLLYTRNQLEPGKGDLTDLEYQQSGSIYPNYVFRFPNHTAQLTIATYGYNFEIARAAVLDLLMEYEIFAEIVLFSQLSPFDMEPLIDSLKRTHKLLTVEEGTLAYGWGGEVAARSVERMSGLQIRRVGALDFPVANARTLEDAILPSQENITRAALALVNQ
jgi:pyruvate/2-oxoglutarate/acetoin dehydrogenase E1 component